MKSALLVLAAGLLAGCAAPPTPGPADWRARWIEPGRRSETHPDALMRREFYVRGDVAAARVFVTSRGLYALELNGEPVGERVLDPGPGEPPRPYQLHDVTSLIRQGFNAVGARLAATPRAGAGAAAAPALLLQLEVHFEDGRVQRITSGPEWRSASSASLGPDARSHVLHDARLERRGFSRARYDEAWRYVRVLPEAKGPGVPAPDPGPGLVRVGELRPAKIGTGAGGRHIVDFGRSLEGRVRLLVGGAAGERVALRLSEKPEPPQGAPRLVYVLRGRSEERYEPPFMLARFRYAVVDEFPGALDADSLTAVEIGPPPP